MQSTIKAVVRYDGTGFAGWQIQPGQRTVQGVIEEALATIARGPIRIAGAGRTDAGAHALGQVFSCTWTGAEPLAKLRRSLSQMLGPDVRIESIEAVPEDFHASYSAKSKWYAYVISQAKEPDPFLDRYAWTVPWDIDAQHVNDLAQRLVGEHDFAGFCSSGSSVETTARTIYSIEMHPGPVVGPMDLDNVWRIEFHGGGFLYKMVRNIVGTLIDIARGQTPETQLHERLNAPAPYHGFTAPAKGLFLTEVLF